MSKVTKPKIVTSGNWIEVYTPYDRGFISDLHLNIPKSHHRWSPEKKAWIVSFDYVEVVAKLLRIYFSFDLDTSKYIVSQYKETVSRTVRIDYVSLPKIRDDGSISSFCWCDDGWNVCIPESVLRKWFCSQETQTDKPTLYEIIGAKSTASQDEIRIAYRRAARTYHPDVNSEPGAHEQFIAIKNAYDILQNAESRARYNAGLAIENMLNGQRKQLNDIRNSISSNSYGGVYIPPLRCGILMVEGEISLDVLHVSLISSWYDIVDSDGRTAVSHWPKGASHFVTKWI